MNIKWNTVERRFESEFSSDFAGDLDAVKTAKFHTTGPPSWIWYAPGIAALNRLRAKKPNSGLTITPEALAVYQPMAAQEAVNDAVKAQLVAAKKEEKKKQRKDPPNTANDTPLAGTAPEKWWIGREDLPPFPPGTFTTFTPPPPPDLKCVSCQQPVYFYEYTELIPQCLWCCKLEDEKTT